VRETLGGRTWGDGGGKKWEHVIETISYEDNLIGCSCGTAIVGIRDGTAFALHAGQRVVLDPAISEQATDAEVREFLRTLTGEQQRPVASAGTVVGTGESADEVLALLLEKLVVWQERCTCATEPVEDCPNYIDGDEYEEMP